MKRRRLISSAFLAALAAILIVLAVPLLLREKEIIVTGLDWWHEPSGLGTTFEVQNNTFERQKVTLSLIAKIQSSSNTPGHLILKRKELTVEVDGKSKRQVTDLIDIGKYQMSPDAIVSVEIQPRIVQPASGNPDKPGA